VVIVLGRPPAQTEYARVRYRSAVQNLEDGLQALSWQLGSSGDLDDQSDEPLAPKGHADPRPDRGHKARLAGGRRQVVEQPAKRGVERHPEDFGHRSYV
jgi:hypothetical protein